MNIFVQVLIPLSINSLSYFILPSLIYIILSIMTIVYFYIQLKKVKLNIYIIEYILSIIILILIIFLNNNIKYILIPIEGLFFIRIIIYNLNIYIIKMKNKDNIESNTENINTTNIEELYIEQNKILKSLNDSKTELSEDMPMKLKNTEYYISENNLIEKNNLNKITTLIDDKIKEDMNNIVEKVKGTIDESYIKNIICEEMKSSELKDNFTNEVIEKIQDGLIDPYNTRQIKNEDIKRLFISTFKSAENEIDIISPWISNWIFKDEDLMEGFKTALDRGVTIKLLYGIGDTNSFNNNYNNKKSVNTEKNAKKLREKFKNLRGKLILKRANTHEKILLCDYKYVLIGSYNFLSFDGKYNCEGVRDECVQYQENKCYIEKLRKEYFNF